MKLKEIEIRNIMKKNSINLSSLKSFIGHKVTLYYLIIKNNEFDYKELVCEHFDPFNLAPSYYFISVSNIDKLIDEFNKRHISVNDIKKYLFNGAY